MPMKSSRRMSAGEDMSQAWRASLRSADWRPLRLSVDMVVFPSRWGGAPPDRMDSELGGAAATRAGSRRWP